MLIAGAQQVLAGGRQDKDRLLMDRYRREGETDMYAGHPPRSNVVSQEPSSYRVGSRNKDNNRAIRQLNNNDERLQQEIIQKYLPPSSQRNPYQQFIPMSQHGQRRINGYQYQNSNYQR